MSLSSASLAEGVRRRALPYLPGLDGLRAISVIAVLLYHADLPWIPGGFLGVEVFFVISGYLITTLLLTEWEATGRIHPGRFWLRRARRLLPALFAMLIATSAYAVLWLPDELARLRGDLAAAFTYVTNWYLILRRESYFEAAGRPSLLKHLWSLAVEEQFYILWPLLLGLVLRFGRRRGAFWATLGLGFLSAAAMMALYVPGSDPSRPYYGTDARAAGLLFGAAYAFAWRPWLAPQGIGRRTRWLADILGIAALVAIVGLFRLVEESGAFLYRGGFPLLDGLTLALIGAAAVPTCVLARCLGYAPLRWLGLRSYAIYLWHWPVYLVTRSWVDVALDGWALLALRSLVTLALAEISYRWVEQPIRKGELGRRWAALRGRQWRRALRPLSWTTLPVSVAAAILAAIGLTSFRLSPTAGLDAARLLAAPRSALGAAASQDDGLAGPPSRGSDPARQTRAPTGLGAAAPLVLASPWPSAASTASAISGHPLASPPAVVGRGLAPTPWPQAALPPGALDPSAPDPSARHARAIASPAWSVGPAPAKTAVAEATRTPPAPGRIILIGDSVMLGAVRELRARFGPEARIDAEVSRQFSHALAMLGAWQTAGLVANVVLIHLGSNGAFSADQFDALMATLRDVPRVYFVTVKVPRRWESPVNEVLAAGVRRWPNARLIDWHAISYRQRFLFRDDGFHVTPEGAQFYADVLALSVAEDFATARPVSARWATPTSDGAADHTR